MNLASCGVQNQHESQLCFYMPVINNLKKELGKQFTIASKRINTRGYFNQKSEKIIY